MRAEKVDTPESKETMLDYGSPSKFDEHDKRLLEALDANARTSLAELSKKAGLSRDAVRNRIQKLVGAGVIFAFRPLYNPPRMGFPVINYVFIALYNPSAQKEQEFLRFLKGHKHVTYVASLIGRWDFILDIMARSQGEFDRVLKEIRQRFPDLVKDYEVYGVLQEYKYEEIGKLVYG